MEKIEADVQATEGADEPKKLSAAQKKKLKEKAKKEAEAKAKAEAEVSGVAPVEEAPAASKAAKGKKGKPMNAAA